MIANVKTIAIYVSDQQKALDFYTRRLGFEVRRNESMGPGSNWIELAPKGAQTCIVIYPQKMMPNWKELKPSVVFSCEDIRKTCKELSDKGVQITQHPKKMQWGTFAKFSDPDGNEFILTGQLND